MWKPSKPDIRKHPSWGYATDEQIEKLNTLGICPERDAIIKKIAEQTKAKGKQK